MKYFKLLFLLTITSVTAHDYQYSLESPREMFFKHEVCNNQVPCVIPQNFDWLNIPDDYLNCIWEIKYQFDFAGQTIILPENVTMLFNGGVLSNGILNGRATVIKVKSENPIFEAVKLRGTYDNEYLKPQWFGAAMDGTTDDRDVFVKTLAEAEHIGAKVLVDRNMFLDLEAPYSKSIFIEDNTWVEGVNDASIIVNNLLSPSFYLVLSKNITFKNITIVYDQTIDVLWGWDIAMHEANLSYLRTYLSNYKKINFSSAFPWSRSPIAWRSIFLMDAPENVLFDNVTVKAEGKAPNQFPLIVFKFREQYSAKQTVTNTTGNTKVPTNIQFRDLTLDGTLMGIQGIVHGFKLNGLKSYRYSDAQDEYGNHIGGSGVGGDYWMPPPHLFYLNPDTSPNYITQNVEIKNTIDYGVYVGAVQTRGANGYCHSLKLVEGVENAKVENYKSYRRDGLWDLGAITNGVFKNIYSESTSEIFEPSWLFLAARFLEPLSNCVFEDVIIKDLSKKAEVYPLDFAEGNNVTMKNVHIYVNELSAEGLGPFGISGSNNTILNSSLTIKRHTAKKTYRPVVFHDEETKEFKGKNNYYDIVINGWRDASSDIDKLSPRLIFQDKTNPNSSFARVTDVRNKLLIEQRDYKKTISKL